MADKKNWVEVVLMPLTIALVGTVGTYFITSQQQKSTETKAAEDRQVKVLEIFSEKITSNNEVERIFALKLLGAIDNDLAAKLAKAVSETEPEQTNVRKVADQVAQEAVARASSLPRIYLHIRDEGNREAARQVANQLVEQGYVIPGVERLVGNGPKSTQLRYFKKSEKSEAKEIADFLRKIRIDAALQYIGAYENSAVIQPHHYELWFAPGEPINALTTF